MIWDSWDRVFIQGTMTWCEHKCERWQRNVGKLHGGERAIYRRSKAGVIETKEQGIKQRWYKSVVDKGREGSWSEGKGSVRFLYTSNSTDRRYFEARYESPTENSELGNACSLNKFLHYSIDLVFKSYFSSQLRGYIIFLWDRESAGITIFETAKL